MRVTYAREEQVKAFLDQVGIENYLPMHYEYVAGKHRRQQVLKPHQGTLTAALYDETCIGNE